MRTYCVAGTKTGARAVKIKIRQFLPMSMVERYVSNFEKKMSSALCKCGAVRKDIPGAGNTMCVLIPHIQARKKGIGLERKRTKRKPLCL